MGAQGSPSHWVLFLFLFFIVIRHFIFLAGLSLQIFRPPFSSIIIASITQIATIQLKNLTKTIKTFTMVIIFQQKNYFTTKEPTKSCVIGQAKIKFFATTIN